MSLFSAMTGVKFAEKTTVMKTIEIKRATDDGLETCSGELLEWQGFQFCLTKVGNKWMAIELNSGASAYEVYSSKPIKKMISGTLERLDSKGAKDLIKAIKRFKKEYPKFQYPINKPVK